jgi:hypothetical protein
MNATFYPCRTSKIIEAYATGRNRGSGATAGSAARNPPAGPPVREPVGIDRTQIAGPPRSALIGKESPEPMNRTLTVGVAAEVAALSSAYVLTLGAFALGIARAAGLG